MWYIYINVDSFGPKIVNSQVHRFNFPHETKRLSKHI